MDPATIRPPGNVLATAVAAETTPGRAVTELEALVPQSPHHAGATLEPDPTGPAHTLSA
ncbi:hypothetical protein [Embleya sp. NPDC020886]|uniref:hypothetical protein n=1 Tax=Embleya sp. NPDC020886 TaxID=3363980 RepID=UPI0037B1946F